MARLLFKDEQGTLHEVYGEKGPRGYSVSDIHLNENYELVVTTEDGRTYISPSIRGPQGPAGRAGTGGEESDGSVIIDYVQTNDNYPIVFRSHVPEEGETSALETLAFEDLTYNPEQSTLYADHVNAQVSDARSAVDVEADGEMASGDTLRILFGKIKAKLAAIQDFVTTGLATEFTVNDPERAAASSLTYSLKQAVDGKAATSHTHISADLTDILPVEKGGTGNTSVDTAPVSGSTKMVTSGGVYSAIHSHGHSAADITSGVLDESHGGTGQSNLDNVVVGEAVKAQELKTARKLMANLASTTNTTFDGSDDTNISITGILGTSNGGTGQSTLTPAVGTHAARAIYAGTGGMTSGTTALDTGKIYLQYI